MYIWIPVDHEPFFEWYKSSIIPLWILDGTLQISHRPFQVVHWDTVSNQLPECRWVPWMMTGGSPIKYVGKLRMWIFFRHVDRQQPRKVHVSGSLGLYSGHPPINSGLHNGSYVPMIVPMILHPMISQLQHGAVDCCCLFPTGRSAKDGKVLSHVRG